MGLVTADGSSWVRHTDVGFAVTEPGDATARMELIGRDTIARQESELCGSISPLCRIRFVGKLAGCLVILGPEWLCRAFVNLLSDKKLRVYSPSPSGRAWRGEYI